MSLQYPPHIEFSFKYSSYHSDLFPFEEGLFGTRVSVVYHENQRILGNISKKMSFGFLKPGVRICFLMLSNPLCQTSLRMLEATLMFCLTMVSVLLSQIINSCQHSCHQLRVNSIQTFRANTGLSLSFPASCLLLKWLIEQ